MINLFEKNVFYLSDYKFSSNVLQKFIKRYKVRKNMHFFTTYPIY